MPSVIADAVAPRRRRRRCWPRWPPSRCTGMHRRVWRALVPGFAANARPGYPVRARRSATRRVLAGAQRRPDALRVGDRAGHRRGHADNPLVGERAARHRPLDPATYIAVSITMCLVTFLACYVPTRRAMRVDPLIVLRDRIVLSEGLRPSDSPTRALARRCAGALRSRGSLALLARVLERASG